MTDNPDCYFGDHDWRGGICAACGIPFRCACGRFLRVEDLDEHQHVCPWVLAHLTPEGTQGGNDE